MQIGQQKRWEGSGYRTKHGAGTSYNEACDISEIEVGISLPNAQLSDGGARVES